MGNRATVPFGALLYEPGNNIWAWPGDTSLPLQGAADVPSVRCVGTTRSVPIQLGLAGVGFSDDNSARKELLRRVGCSTCRLIRGQYSCSGVNRASLLPKSSGSTALSMDGPTVPGMFGELCRSGGYFLATGYSCATRRHLGSERARYRRDQVCELPQHADQCAEQRRGGRREFPDLAHTGSHAESDGVHDGCSNNSNTSDNDTIRASAFR